MKNIKYFEKALKVFPLGSQDNLWGEAICSVVFCLGSDIRWYIIEGQRESNNIIMFGIVIGLCEDEFGYVSLKGLLENPWVYQLTDFDQPLLKRLTMTDFKNF